MRSGIRGRTAVEMAVRIDLAVEDPAWKKSGVGLRRLRDTASLALRRGGRDVPERPELTLLLADDARLQALNASFRGKDAPTNVLSFPAGTNDRGYLGDVAVAYGVAAREAAEKGIGLAAHVQHLVVHGVLHLLGYDHVTAAQARIMEPLEVAVLKELAISDPYQPRATRPRQT